MVGRRLLYAAFVGALAMLLLSSPGAATTTCNETAKEGCDAEWSEHAEDCTEDRDDGILSPTEYTACLSDGICQYNNCLFAAGCAEEGCDIGGGP
jgi:hypothetical protein